VSTHVITVEQFNMAPAPRKLLFQRVRDRRLSRTGQACEPDDETLGHASAPKSPQRPPDPLIEDAEEGIDDDAMTKITTRIASSCRRPKKSRAKLDLLSQRNLMADDAMISRP